MDELSGVTAGAIRHGLRGRPSSNRIGTGLRDYALSLMRKTYSDFGPTLASEKLAEHSRSAQRFDRVQSLSEQTPT